MRQLLKGLAEDERGLETVEWAVIATLMVVGLIAVLTVLGDNVQSVFVTMRDATAGN